MNARTYQLPKLFPTATHANYGISVTGPSSHFDFCAIAAQYLPDLHLLDTAQFFGRYRYEAADASGMLELAIDANMEVKDGYQQIDNITDEALNLFTSRYGDRVTKDDIFFYVYGILHSVEYRKNYVANLKKMLPRIPLVQDPWPFIDAGRKLSTLHLGYESVEPYPLGGLDTRATGDEYEFFRVQKMGFAKTRQNGKLVTDRSTMVFNSRITLSEIPSDAYRYILGPRSAIEWIIDRYQVRVDKASGITNDPNDWSREADDPRYILDLLARIVTVSLESMKVIDGLPPLEIRER